jgi:hypothetical protein
MKVTKANSSKQGLMMIDEEIKPIEVTPVPDSIKHLIFT